MRRATLDLKPISSGGIRSIPSPVWLTVVAAIAFLLFAIGAATPPDTSSSLSFPSLLAFAEDHDDAPAIDGASVEAAQPMISPTGVRIEGFRAQREGSARSGAFAFVDVTNTLLSFQRRSLSMVEKFVNPMRRMSSARARAFLMVFLN